METEDEELRSTTLDLLEVRREVPAAIAVRATPALASRVHVRIHAHVHREGPSAAATDGVAYRLASDATLNP